MTAETQQQQKIAFFRLAIAVGILMLSGCTTYWAHRTKPAHLFEQEFAGCKIQHTERQCKDYGPSSQTSCLKNTITGGVDCLTNSSPGGTKCTENVNDQQVQMCMYQKGWRKVDKDGKVLPR